MSLASLKDRLQRISQKPAFDVSAPKKQLKGNKPEDWLEYIDHIAESTPFTSDLAKHETLSDLYDQAFKSINAGENKYNEAYAQLFVSFGRMKSEYVPDDACVIFNQARSITRRFAIVHIASAQFELDRDNKGKAMKQLEKALLYEAKPTEEVEEALQKLKHGERCIYVSPVCRRRNDSGMRKCSSGSESSEEIRMSTQHTDQLSANLSADISFSIPGKQPHFRPPEPMSEMKASVSSLHHTGINSRLSLDGSGLDGLKSFRSTPLLNSENKGSVGLPARVKKINMPFEVMNEEDDTSLNNTMDSFKPLEPKLTEVEHAPVKSESVFKPPLETAVTVHTTVSHDTAEHKPGLRPFRSTPLLNSEKRRAVNVGLPSRVKKINLPFDTMNIDEGDESMNTMDSFKPLETKSTRGFNNHAHTSGYLSMVSEGTIPMDTKPHDKQKMSPLEEKPVEEPAAGKDSLPVPVMNPHPPVLQTPNNKQFIPSTPMTNVKMMIVNDQQYAVLSVLGKGGSSKVYQVFDVHKKIKAIKEVNLDNANDIIVEGYKNEIKLLQRLQYCDKVIKMYDWEYKENEDKLYVVMEAGSEDLATFFRSQTQNGTPLSDRVTWFYWDRMLLAVQALHKEGIIHSDLKPANFLLVGGSLKLIDFGIAKAIQQDKTSVILETQIGTLNYMSPEAIMINCTGETSATGKKQFKIGVKSDVWSLGCILYNMVYGRTPFQRLKNDFFKLQAITNADFPIEFSDIPNKHLMDVMKRCLNREPKQRPSIDELLVHPYLKGAHRGAEETPPPGDKKLNMMEALVSTLSDKFACSPGTLRSLIHNTIEQDGGTGNTSSNVQGQHKSMPDRKPMVSIQPTHKPESQITHKPEGQIKHLRTPLTSLNLADIKQSGQAASNNQQKQPDAT